MAVVKLHATQSSTNSQLARYQKPQCVSKIYLDFKNPLFPDSIFSLILYCGILEVAIAKYLNSRCNMRDK